MRHPLVIALAAVVTSSLGAQPAVQQAAQRALLSVDAQRADFDLLRRAIEEAHGGLHRWVPKAELDRRWAAHRARLDRPMTSLALAGVLSEAIAELRDGHARLEYDSVTNAALAGARLLPLRVALEGEQLVVVSNDTPADSAIRPGMVLLAIDGRPTRDIVATLLPRVSGDGFIETGRRTRFARDLAVSYWRWIAQPDSFAITARDEAGRVVTATLHGVTAEERRTNANPVNATLVENAARLDGPRGTIALEFLRDSTVARLRVRAFDGQSFPATLDSAFRVLRERATRALILDLRGNGGGVDLYGALLVSHLVARPFRYFDHIHLTTIAPSFATWLPRTFESLRAGTVPHAGGGFRVTEQLHRGVGEQQPQPHPFTGPLVVLIDGGSFSTTADVAAQLRSLRRATFVGEETAGTYEGNTSGLNALIVLPSSGLRLRIMMYGYWNAVMPPPSPGRGTRPDHDVTRRVADLLRGRDPMLERAIEVVSR